ncbi:hypothetical protein [Granulicella arctica]|uniref:Uncharacterized protein n=1 Tax=Granulicella arctica TaxID=940613 RepID=A0A7Y9PGL8_9BACT|nr:hypothetical protein [Granulicella arctica]NYF78768.1 hypothetical protein [Granulicella arctica]
MSDLNAGVCLGLRRRRIATVLFAGLLCGSMCAQTVSHDLVVKMVANENLAEQHRDHYLYLSQERSERTGGHLWTERVAETSAGKVRMLIAEDGQPLAGGRLAVERVRLADIAAHPDVFEKREQALRNDERHAKDMLELLPKAFLFDSPSMEGSFTLIHFKPNPAYEPQSLEERILHAMTGSVLIDPVVRLHRIEGRLPEDVNIGFGLIATIKAGSNFSTTRDRAAGNEWKTAVLDTDITGRAIFFKAIGKKEHAERSDYKLLPIDMTVAQAVAMLEQ